MMRQLTVKFLQFPLTKIVVGYALCFAFFAVVQRFAIKPLFSFLFENGLYADSFRYFLSMILLLASYYCFTRFYEGRTCYELQLANWKKEILGGFTIGFGCIAISIFVLSILGYYHFIDISLEHYNLRLFTMLLLAALIEDLLNRALMLRIAEQWLGSYAALALISSIELLHLFNPNVEISLSSVFLFLLWGFSMGMLFIYSKRVWLPFAFHVGWNFAQPFFGSNLTGTEDMGRIINSRIDGPELLTGGTVGIEDSIFTTCILLMVGLTFLYLSIKEGKIVKGKFNNFFPVTNDDQKNEIHP
jgi:membrane protease YdiL (CAAX protease family)